MTAAAAKSNLDATSGYVRKTVDLGAVTGQYVAFEFTATEDLAAPTYLLLDDTALSIHP